MALDIVEFIIYNMNMSSDNILAEFTAFLEKSAVVVQAPAPSVMSGAQQTPTAAAIPKVQQPPAATTITAAPQMQAPTTATNQNQTSSLVSPTVVSASPPRIGGLPQANNYAPTQTPKPSTNTSKPMKATSFNPSTKK